MLIGLEEVDLEPERWLFLLNRLIEEIWIVLVELSVIGVWIDLIWVEPLMLLLLLPIVLIFAIIVVPSSISSVVVANAIFSIVSALSTVIVIVIVVASAGASTRLRLIASVLLGWCVRRSIILIFTIVCVSSIRSLAITKICRTFIILSLVLRTIISVRLLPFGWC